ncbi:MAG TPA: efflux RND transporter permease subunit [Polyangiaceae bacterium]|nr:efflux RND transporter permease subunit [Polyangiaceae bacterium]
MTLSEVAIRRPVFTVMIAVGILVLGLVGYSRLGSDLFPDVSFPVVAVTVPYPGASPSEVETQIAKPIEDAVVGLNGLDRVRSFSREGVSTTVVLFTLGTDIAQAATEVRERVSQARAQFPDDAKEPIIGRFDVSAAPIMTYVVRGQGSLSGLRKYADKEIRTTLEQVPGVAKVTVRGGAKEEVQIDLHRERLEALRLTPVQIVQRLRADNLNVPAGHYDEGEREVTVRTTGEFKTVEDIRNVVVASAPDGSVVRLRDVASVEDGYAEVRTRTYLNGTESVSFDVLKQSGENTVGVAERVKAKLAEMQHSFPKGVETALIIDQAEFIQQDISQVQHEILFGGLMAILVILIFMMDLRSTLISAVALPTSVIGTFFAMYLLGYTLNMMSLLALSLSIGLLIDDAVVVRENIFRHMEMGKGAMQAAIDGTREVTLAVLATTATIVAVFMPVAFVEGMVGQFFRQFGVTVSVAVCISMFVAFTLDPMLSSRFSGNIHGPEKFSWLKRPFRAFFAELDAAYARILNWAVGHKLAVGGVALGSIVLMVGVMGMMGSEFVNSEDRGQFIVEVELPAGTSLAETKSKVDGVEKTILAHPEVRTVFTTLGPDEEINKVRFRILTTKKVNRTVGLDAIKQDVRQATASLERAKVAVTDPPFAEGAATEAPIMINIRGEEYPDIEKVAFQVEKILRRTPGVDDIQVRYSPGRPELVLNVDRELAANRGLSLADVALGLRTAMAGADGGDLRRNGDEVPLLVRLDAAGRDDPHALELVSVPGPQGPVKVGDISRFERASGPQVIERENRQRQIVLWATPVGRPLGDVAKEFQAEIDKIQMPAKTSIFYDGQLRLMNETNSNMGLALMLGIVFIYLVLASQFESFIHPVTIMVTIPLALVGGVVGLFLTGKTMAMGAMIGIILLVGLVTKNAILLLDRALERVRDHGETPLQAILEAGSERLRPILMTSMAMILGMLPTAMIESEGSEFRAPMAIAVIAGVISSTFLSLVVVPVVYLGFEGLKARLGKWLGLSPRAVGSPAE